MSDAQSRTPIAHAARDEAGGWREPHLLDRHLAGTAKLAAEFAAPFGGSAWAFLAGQWHDLGKYRLRFQDYIRLKSGFEADAHIKGEAGKAPHSTAGALLACDRFGVAGRVPAYLIAGHHAGLSDWTGGLDSRLDEENARNELNETLARKPPAAILDPGGFEPNLRAIPGGPAGFALWLRMLFSCLVDADFLDTEAYMNPAKAEARGQWPSLAVLKEQFDRHMEGLAADADKTEVNRLRGEILAQCRAKAAEAPGLFSLDVPTGGGKTLSSMAFALEHAARYGKKRIIYAIPYTSIIEQTADIFREIFGEAVVEHHSNAEADPKQENHQSRLACENWDAPIVVTTNVQFFESLFAAKTSRCRKLHNIADSIVVLDEAQLLPPDFLQPIAAALKILAEHYGVSVVLSTATQPVLSTRKYFDPKQNFEGLDKVREIVAAPEALHEALKRVRCRLPQDWHTPTPWESLAEELAGRESVLAIVNTRAQARGLHALLPQGAYHLSALMCGAHRSQAIADIRARLKAGIPTRVVSTQLVEAGVDLDFPVVYRALAGLDSIAQAAGRCNREGRRDMGEVVVFIPPEAAPPGLLRKGVDACRSALHGLEGKPLTRQRFARYFEEFYRACDLDAQGIGKLLQVDGQTLAVKFRTAAEAFKLIPDDGSSPVVCLYRGPDGEDRTVDMAIASLKKDGPERWLMRKLQRYVVNLPEREIERLSRQGDIEEIIPGMFVQISDVLYDPVLGLCADGPAPNAGKFMF